MQVLKNFVKKQLKDYEEKRKFDSQYKIEGEIQGKKNMLFVLAGYKPYLWEDVFTRLKRNELDDMEICIASSGKYCTELSEICKKNNWIYLSTTLNHVCVITNIIMKLFSSAEYIFKLDEDIYIPDGYFATMLEDYKIIEEAEPVDLGYICPQLPLGFYGMHDFLVEQNKLEDFENRFGKHKIGGTLVNPYLRAGTGVDEYIWELIGVFDDRAAEYSKRDFSYQECYSRPGIAAILFKRSFWDKIGGLTRSRGIGVGNNGDEGQITAFCALNYQVCYCVNNVLVGHFSFGGSEGKVLEFRSQHPEIFALKNE